MYYRIAIRWEGDQLNQPPSWQLQDARASLAQDDEIVVYCSNDACSASVFAYEYLVRHGYTHVRRYAGGILDWEEAGYPLEGEMVAEKTP